MPFRAGLVLRALNESAVRSICGEVLYNSGLQDYMQGKVSERKFSKNSLSGKVEGKSKLTTLDKGKRKQFVFAVIVTLERSSSKKFRTYGDCQCSVSREEGALCQHIASLLIAWVRYPRDFKESDSTKFDFEAAKRRVMSSLDKLVDAIEKGSSSTDDLEILQETYAKLKLWAANVREFRNDNCNLRAGETVDRHAGREFSSTINYVSLAIMSAIENKYEIESAIQLYNNATASTFGRLLEMFAQGPGVGKSVTSAMSGSSIDDKESVKSNTTEVQPHTSRTWDRLVEEFASH
jgi:hypothetical protein